MSVENGTPEIDLNSPFGTNPVEGLVDFCDLPELPDAVWARIVADAMDPDTPVVPQTLLPDESAVPGQDDPDLLYLDGADADSDSGYDDSLVGPTDSSAAADDSPGSADVDDGEAGPATDADCDSGGETDDAGLSGLDGSVFEDFGSSDWGAADPLGADPLGADPLGDAQPWADPDPLDDGDSADF